MKASLKTINIDPPIGIRMGGFSEREHGCTGIHDHIYATILALDDGVEKAALVCCDVIGMDLHGVHYVRELVGKARQIAPENIMISATHTHSSVAAARMQGVTFIKSETENTEETTYYQLMLQQIAGGIVWALDDLEPAKVGFGTGELRGFCTNRNDPEAYFDPTVYLLKVERQDGSLMGLIASYACHPTILNHENYLITSDFVGYFRMGVAKLLPDVVPMFIQGAAGSTSTRFTKRGSTFEEAQRVGTALAAEVVKTAELIVTADTLTIKGITKKITLPVKDFPSDEQCEAEIERCRSNLAALEAQDAQPQLVRKAYVTLQGAERNLAAKRRITFTEVESEMQMISFGAFTVCSVPGDVFAEIGRDIRADSTLPNPIVVGYGNDFVSYIVSKEGYMMDCYEKNMTIMSSDAQGVLLEAAKLMELTLGGDAR